MESVASNRSSLKERQRQEREALILKVAEEVLTEKGYYETSIDEIASRVGIAKGTVYLHFPSKEELVLAIFERDIYHFLDIVEQLSAMQSTAQEKLQRMLQFMYGGVFSTRTQLLYSMYHDGNLRKAFVEKKACMRDLWERLARHTMAILEEGKANEEFDPTVPTPIMLSAFFNLLLPRSFERLITDQHLSNDEVVKYLGQIYFKGIVAK